MKDANRWIGPMVGCVVLIGQVRVQRIAAVVANDSGERGSIQRQKRRQ